MNLLGRGLNRGDQNMPVTRFNDTEIVISLRPSVQMKFCRRRRALLPNYPPYTGHAAVRSPTPFGLTVERVNLPNSIYLFLHYNSLKRTFRFIPPIYSDWCVQTTELRWGKTNYKVRIASSLQGCFPRRLDRLER